MVATAGEAMVVRAMAAPGSEGAVMAEVAQDSAAAGWGSEAAEKAEEAAVVTATAAAAMAEAAAQWRTQYRSSGRCWSSCTAP